MSARRHMRLPALLGAIAAFAAVAPAGAQQQPDYLSVTARGGAITWDDAASMQTAGFVGLDAQYAFNKYFSVGTNLMVSLGNSRGEDFTTALTFGLAGAGGDTTSYYYLSQSVSFVDVGLYGMLRLPVGKRMEAYALGGGGAYSMFFDPQVNRGERRQVAPSINYGVGFWYALSNRVGFQFDVRALTLTDYDWRLLDPSAGRSPNVTFPEDFPTPPERKSTVTNLTYSIGFRYIPGFFGDDN